MALVVARAPRCRPSRGSGAESAGLRRSPGRPRGWFLTALLDLAVPQHDHAVGRRATDTVRAQSALGSDGRWHIFAQGVCEPRGRAVGESSQRALRERRPPSTQRCQPSARLGPTLFWESLCTVKGAKEVEPSKHRNRFNVSFSGVRSCPVKWPRVQVMEPPLPRGLFT